MKKFIILITVTAIFLLVFVAGGLVAKPVDKINEKYDVAPFTVNNPCTGEEVELSGTAHVNGRLSSGKLHLECHLVGDSDSDTEYIANGTMNLQVEGGPFIFEGTGIIIITCISKGEEQNFILKARGCTIEIVCPDPLTLHFAFIDPEWECVE